MVSVRTDGIACTAHGSELTVWRAKAGVSDRLGGGRVDVAELSPFLQPKAPTHPPSVCPACGSPLRSALPGARQHGLYEGAGLAMQQRQA